MPILTLEMLQAQVPFFRSGTGSALGSMLLRRLGVQRLNEINDTWAGLDAPDFAGRVLQSVGITDYGIGYAERLGRIPQEGPFITVSNHPYGGADGVILVDLLGHLRPDYKVLVNKILSLVRPLAPSFIPVVPKTLDSHGVEQESIQGIRMALTQLREGHPLGLFPAGAVSDLHLRNLRISDRDWQEPILRLIRRTESPVIPIRFFGRNSLYFYLLGMLGWKIRTLRLPRELLNKQNVPVRIGIGEPILPEEWGRLPDITAFGELLRSRVYGMIPPPHFTPRSQI